MSRWVVPRPHDLVARAICAALAGLVGACGARSDLALASSAGSEGASEAIFIVGASNAIGQGLTRDLPTTPRNLQAPLDDVPYAWRIVAEDRTFPISENLATTLRPRGETHGAEVTLGWRLFEQRRHPLILKWGEGGISLSGHLVGDESRYADARDFFRQRLDALAPSAHVTGVFLIAGGNDAVSDAEAQDFRATLEVVVQQFRRDFGDDVPVVTYHLHVELKRPHRDVVRAEMLEAAEVVVDADGARPTSSPDPIPRTFLVNVDDQKINDDHVHLPSGALQALGSRAAGVIP